MALPKLTVKQYTLLLPSTGEKVIYRPFTVKEEKILLQSIDEDDESQVRALRQVINNCLISDLDVDKLPMFDLDYIWIKLRSKSVQEIVSIPFECLNKLPEGETRKDDEGNEVDYCGTVVNVAINLDAIDVKKNPENNPKIEIQDGIGLIMRYPTFEIVQKLSKIKDSTDVRMMFEIMSECVEMIYDGEKTYEKEHINKDELLEFLESMTQEHFTKVMHFFETLPVLRHQVHFRCPKCKHEVDVVIEGTKSFLASDSPTIQ
jgi:hypothetical protein